MILALWQIRALVPIAAVLAVATRFPLIGHGTRPLLRIYLDLVIMFFVENIIVAIDTLRPELAVSKVKQGARRRLLFRKRQTGVNPSASSSVSQ